MLELLSVINAASALFLSFLVFTVRNDTNVSANRWLAAFLLALGFFMLEDGLVEFGIYAKNLWMTGTFSQTIFVIAPLLYLAVSDFVALQKQWRWTQLLHFLPATVFLILSIPGFFASDEEKMQYLLMEIRPTEWTDWISLSLLFVQFITYAVLCFRKLSRHQHNLQNITADTQQTSLDWLLYFLIGISAMTIIWVLSVILTQSYTETRWQEPIYFVGVYALGYFALKQKEIFPFSAVDRAEVAEMLLEQADKQKRLYYFSPERLEVLKAKLIHQMDTEKPYLNPELNLPGLAAIMHLSVHELSELVNQGFQENFAQFINRYRIEESKRLLLSRQYEHLSIVGIAFEAGFNSKTTFNTTFKKLTGLSPSEYQKREQKGLIQGKDSKNPF